MLREVRKELDEENRDRIQLCFILHMYKLTKKKINIKNQKQHKIIKSKFKLKRIKIFW